ncbi:MAG: ethylbenzene dehydrogenase-related protein [Halioglobus sp.]
MTNTFLITIALVTLLGACTERDSRSDNTVATPPTPVSIDDTPVEALSVGGIVNVSQQPGAALFEPNSEAWRAAQEYSLDLSLAPPVHQSINLRYDPATPPVSVKLRAGSDTENLYLRLRWTDTTQNTVTSREQFSDGVAIQFALASGPATSYMMGTTATPVNIWYWKAGADAPQNLAAGGFGSTTTLAQGKLSTRSLYREGGEWVVVFSRPLNQAGEHQVDLNQDALSIALALWQGDARQRDGLKHVSQGWITLQ